MKKLHLISLALMQAGVAYAEVENEDASPKAMEVMTVLGSKEDIQNISGSAYSVDREALEEFEYTDLNQVLMTVPGVYIRQEDGYGLRPNIGLRGVTSDRSQKITIMEDGILITPAPYSAPAAYYIPNVNRMQAVEIFKGPSAIKFGPNTVGGAVNLATRGIPHEPTGELDVSYGTDNFQKLRGLYGATFDQFGYVIEGLRYSADGFKELDGGGDTGFVRNDINAKLMWQSSRDADIYQRVDVKIGYADEDSDETYLGLTEDDFAKNPVRRYAASGLDKFESEHTQLHVIHQMEVSSQLSFVNRAYVNRFDRSWLKFDGFGDNTLAGRAPDVSEILRNPDAYTSYMSLIRGEENSSLDDKKEWLDLTNNDREYGSQGLEVNLTYLFDTAGVEHKIESGLRYHYDYVERDHSPFAYLMIDGQMQLKTDAVLDKKALNKSESHALSAYIQDTLSWDKWVVNVGARVESIDSKQTDYLDADRNNQRKHTEVIPGMGVVYQWNDRIGLLAGINKGFSPNSPRADDSVNPEESINYEYGLRYHEGDTRAEVIGFFSDYKNLIGRCRNSETDCDDGDEFNGGRVEIAGVEISAEQLYTFNDVSIPLGLTYTYTESAFQESFVLNFSQWGEVQKGDALPYLPENQWRLYTGVKMMHWDLLASIKYSDEMRDLPGQGAMDEHQYTPALTTVDLSASYFVNDSLTLQMTADNITDEIEVVSYRPFGARSNKPRSVTGTVKYRF